MNGYEDTECEKYFTLPQPESRLEELKTWFWKLSVGQLKVPGNLSSDELAAWRADQIASFYAGYSSPAEAAEKVKAERERIMFIAESLAPVVESYSQWQALKG